MRRSARCLLLPIGSILAAMASIAIAAEEGPALGGPPSGDGPLKVTLGFSVVNITEINEREETIEFEGAIYLSWMDPRLAYDSDDETTGEGSAVPDTLGGLPRRVYQGDFQVR